MPRVTSHMSVSLDGFVAGPNQTRDNPIGEGGMALHTWHLEGLDDPGREVDARWQQALLSPRGAYVMGRNMFGPIRGEWSEDWRGWWGDEPPYHAPVFVLTHHAHDPIELDGGTTFFFVTDGFDAALAQAKDAAGDLDVDIAGGASAVRQGLQSNAIDDLRLDIVPIVLGHGERLFDDVSPMTLEAVQVEHSPLATHVHYRIG